MTTKRFSRLATRLGCATGIFLAAFASAAPPAATPASSTAVTSQAATPAALTVSLLDVMRASVQIPADGIWGAAGGDKLSDDEWLLAEQDSINLVAAASLMAIPGTGRNDRQWVSSPDWKGWVKEYRSAAQDVRSAVKVRDLTKLSAAGDRLTKVCEDCHAKYRPQTPSDGVSRYPFYPKRELAR